MATCKGWVRFDFEYRVLRGRLDESESPTDMFPEIREWAKRWFITDGDMDMLRKQKYRRSWMIRVSDLLGEKEAIKLMAEMIMK